MSAAAASAVQLRMKRTSTFAAGIERTTCQRRDAAGGCPAPARRGTAVTTCPGIYEGWRRRDNLSWRASAWAMRRMVTGGMLLEAASEDVRKRAGLANDALALFAKHVGEYGAHALAKQSGFVKGDVLVSIDGQRDAIRETDLFVRLLRTKKVGDEIPVTVWRDGTTLELKLRMQE